MGLSLGAGVGNSVGATVGVLVGPVEGVLVGPLVGASVGDSPNLAAVLTIIGFVGTYTLRFFCSSAFRASR